MRATSMKRLFSHPIIAVSVGLAVRLFFVLRFATATGDTGIYEQLAENWLKRGVYGLLVAGQLAPVDMRMPGYATYLALVYWLSGHTGAAARTWVLLGQVAIDLATAALVAVPAGFLLSKGASGARRARIGALWLSCTCPFIANYAAVPLTEVFATFFCAGALGCFALYLRDGGEAESRALPSGGSGESFFARSRPGVFGILGAFLVGLGTLFRPETPLLLVVACVG